MAEPEGMLCPVCKTLLVMTERQNVEIDYCPKCRGVWLCRGELDKIIEHSMAQQIQAPRQSPGDRDRRDDDDRYRGSHHGGYRRNSWLSDIFD